MGRVEVTGSPLSDTCPTKDGVLVVVVRLEGTKSGTVHHPEPLWATRSLWDEPRPVSPSWEPRSAPTGGPLALQCLHLWYT